MKHRAYVSLSNVIVSITIVVTLAIGSFAQTETILHSFTGGSDGGFPQAGLIFDSKGNLYGTTTGGGTSSNCTGCGTVFQLVPDSNGAWTENVLYTFGSSANLTDGVNPFGSVVFDSKGNLYGTTTGGGSSFAGTVFELSPGSDGVWTEKVLYNFTGGSDGSGPNAGLTIDKSGNLYGMTSSGGASGFGTVFELVPEANETWSEKVLHSFTGGNDGSSPYNNGLVFDDAGNLYGSTPNGGLHDYGVVFKLTPGAEDVWTEQVLYAFTDTLTAPFGNLILGSDGNIYGTSFFPFELSQSANGSWTAKTLHVFVGGSDGADPEAGVISDTKGNLYGTTYTGGLHRGTVFELIPESNGAWTEKILHRFSPNGNDGTFPTFGALVMDSKRNLYGTTPSGGASKDGTVFEVTP
jgi:uncharacterized repeat protein (TIGR03803 family)